jgi:hypothetical protein
VAIIHYDVTFSQGVPTLVDLKHQVEKRTGLEVHMWKDALDKDLDHEWPHIGHVKESGSIECDEADGADLEITLGTKGVRLTFVDPSVQPYFRDQVVAVLRKPFSLEDVLELLDSHCGTPGKQEAA